MQKGGCEPLMVQGDSKVCIGKTDGESHSPPVMVESLVETGSSGSSHVTTDNRAGFIKWAQYV